MAQYVSGSELQQHRLKHFFLPSPLTATLYVLVSLLMLTLLSIKSIWRLFPQDSFRGITGSDIAPLTDRFISFQDELATPAVMLLWTMIGAVTYTIIWLLENVIFAAKSEVQQSQYLSGGLRPQKKYWQGALVSNVFLFLSILIWIGGIALYLRILLPAFSQLFNSGLHTAPTHERFLNLAAAVLANAVILYALLLFQRMLSRAWRLNRPSSGG